MFLQAIKRSVYVVRKYLAVVVGEKIAYLSAPHSLLVRSSPF